jgi:hypothetical protein
MVDNKNISVVARILHKNRPVILKKTRELSRPVFKEGRLMRLGSLIVIAYKVPRKEMMGKIRNCLRRSPCICLCRGVYAFSQQNKRLDKSGRLVDATRFWEFIQEIDSNAVIIPRIIVVNPEAMEKLLEEAQERVEREVGRIIEGYKSLHQLLIRGEIDSQHATRTAVKLRKSLSIVRKVAAFYEEWLKINLSRILTKPYPIIRKVRSSLPDRYGIVH